MSGMILHRAAARLAQVSPEWATLLGRRAFRVVAVADGGADAE